MNYTQIKSQLARDDGTERGIFILRSLDEATRRAWCVFVHLEQYGGFKIFWSMVNDEEKNRLFESIKRVVSYDFTSANG